VAKKGAVHSAGTASALKVLRKHGFVILNNTSPPMNRLQSFFCSALRRVTLLCVIPLTFSVALAEPLKVAYSDWPGWVVFDIAIKKDWFKQEGLDVQFLWYDYAPSMDAFSTGKVDAVGMTNGDALVTGSGGKPSVAVIITDFSSGNDMIVAKPGIESVKDLKGRKVGVEVGLVDHLLLLNALESNGMKETDVTLVNTPTNETPQVLGAGAVDAIGAWQPNSGQAMKTVQGSKPIYTSAQAPGLIYDLIYVSRENLEKRRADWAKFVKVWYRIIDYMQDPANLDEALKILAARDNVKPEEYEPFLKGTHLLTLQEALQRWKKGDGLSSIYGSTKVVDDFNVKYGVYKQHVDFQGYLDPSLTEEYARSVGTKAASK
jgi:NitT/TauT family transport system substrate-binding protein